MKKTGFDALRPDERELVGTVLMHEEIRNGGFLQWFTNSFSDYAPYAIRFLRRIGARDRLRLITKASGIFPKRRIPATQQQRRAFARKWTKAQIEGLEPINDEYYAIKRDLYDDMVELV